MTTTQIYDGLKEQKKRVGSESFWKFTDQVYGFLKIMRPGETMNLETSVDPKDHKLYILACCLYFIEISDDFTFSDNYKTLKRYDKLERTPGASPAITRARKNNKRNSN